MLNSDIISKIFFFILIFVAWILNRKQQKSEFSLAKNNNKNKLKQDKSNSACVLRLQIVSMNRVISYKQEKKSLCLYKWVVEIIYFFHSNAYRKIK